MITSDQLKDVLDRADKLKHYLKIDEKKIEFEEEDLRTQAPDFWEDQKRAEEQMKKVKSIKKWLDGFQDVRTAADELQLAFDFFKEEMVTEAEVDENYQKAIKAIEALELKNMLRQKEDPMDAVLKINSGAGGTESQDWASMLMRMYQRWAEAHGYKVSISNLQDGDEAGIKSVTMQIEGGEFAYGYLKSENGVHRLVRVSPFNAQGKRMTSLRIRFRLSTGRRHDRSICRPRQVVMGHFPLKWCRRSERQQGRVGCSSALLVYRPRYWRGGGNPHREYRNARPAQKQRTCHGSAALSTL